MPKDRYDRWVDELLAVSPWTARQLRRIGNDPNIERYLKSDSERWHANVLPPDRTILDEICGLETEQFDELVDDGVIHPEMKRGDVKRRLIERRHGGSGRAEPPALPDGKYGVILADPPWAFETRTNGGKNRSAENHYPCMTVDEIAFMRVMERAADDAVLFLWVTSDTLMHAPRVMIEWGFSYASTAFVWVKEGGYGMGYWTRKGVEICLLGTRGNPKRLAMDVAEVIHAPRGQHSEKPEEQYERIERLVSGPYLELFARKPRPGWDAWGNDPALAEEAAE